MTGPAGQVRVGVLSFHNSKETKALCNAVSDLGHDPVWLRESNTNVYAGDGRVEFDPEVDVVVNRLLLSNADRPLEELEIANALEAATPMVNTPSAVLTALHKFATATRLAARDVPIPESRMGLSGPQLDAAQDSFDGPPVQKTGIGTHGDTVRRLDDRAVSPRVGSKRTFLQQYLEQEDAQSDVRVYVVDGAVLGAMERITPEDDWRANIARGGTATDASERVPDRVSALAVEAADALGLDVAGVDLMERDGDWMVIEVNPTAGFKGFFDATGRSPAPYIARHAVERAGGDVVDDRVEAVAASLDDSVPDCKPNAPDDAPSQPTIGYTEAVLVNGQERTAAVEAKADTGAARTCIGIDLAGDVGAGPIQSQTTVRTGSQKSSTTRPLVDVEVAVRDRWYTVTASIEDRSHMNHPMILGRDLLEKFRLDISDGTEQSTPDEE
jgi:RimK family alpha-L-glutamate ligase